MNANSLCSPTPRAPRNTLRKGVSLLELLLALGLSTVVMGLIAMSINLNFRMYDTKRTSIEEARLARSVLRHIADDIRAAVQHMPPDLSGLETVIGNSQNASSALGGAGLGALAGAAGQNGNAGTDGTGAQGGSDAQASQQGGTQNDTGGGNQNGAGGGSQNGTGGNGLPVTTSTIGGVQSQTAEAGSIYGEEQASGIIGLYGSSTELQIDISRLPRVDQFQASTDPNNLTGVVDIPSDMKTVSYFLRPAAGLTEVGTDGRGRGLMRRVLDRAVSKWETENGGTGNLGQLEMMAEEVVGLQFMYFDGSSWTSDWDSASMEGLPKAIEITVILQSLADQQAAASSTQIAATTEEDNERLYTLTVNLPTATSYEDKQMAAEEKRLAAEEKTALAQTGAIDTSGDAAAAGGAGGGFGGMGGGQNSKGGSKTRGGPKGGGTRSGGGGGGGRGR